MGHGRISRFPTGTRLWDVGCASDVAFAFYGTSTLVRHYDAGAMSHRDCYKMVGARLIGMVALFTCVVAGGVRADETIDYGRRIKPLLTARCYTCHGALKQKSNLRLDT